ncbi:hypothetical protein [Corynebacterium xerosis]|uniref:hypothetical protein n=1 Tax=Corynebacterium xerosis TaxID=1725 RepID=UPI00366FEBE4
MGRHSDGQPNYRVAKGPLILLLVVILVGALVFAWFALRASDRDALGAGENCVKGDLTLVIAADPAVAGLVRDDADAWAATDPVVRDYCVRPQVTVNGSQQVLDVIREHSGDGNGTDETDGTAGGIKPVLPAVWAPADDVFVERARDAGVVGLDGEAGRLAPSPVGLAVTTELAGELENASWSDLAARPDFAIATPGGPDAVASSVVNARLNPGVPASGVLAAAEPRIAAGGAMTSEALLTHLAQDTADGFTAVAATEPMVAAAAVTGSGGLDFVSPADSPSLSAPMVAFTSGGPIDETNARAAAEFVEFAREDGGADADDPGDGPGPLDGAAGEILPDIAARVTDPTAGAPTEAPEQPAATEPAGSTLVLLDTSSGMDIGAVRTALTPLLDRAIDGEGRRVALWNYSSPMSEGVTRPVRPNVRFGTGAKDRSAEVLAQLGTGGEPWLWRSVGPAVDYVAQTHSPGVANRVVLVTTGADATGDDAGAAIERIAAAAGPDRPVRVDVVIVGEDATGGDLAALASATGGSVHFAGEDLSAALVAAMGL